MENPLHAYNPEGIQWSWVDFSLGEDVRTESRLLQDETWKNAVSDGRSHISHREYSNVHCREFINAIDDYKTVKFLMKAYASNANVLSQLNIELMTHIIDFALPGQGPLVGASDMIRNALLAAASAATAAVTSDNNEHIDSSKLPIYNSFRVSARCRPLLVFEKQGGAYNTVDPLESKNEVVVHDGKLARGGRWLTMSHKTFPLDKVWRTAATNAEVCSSEVEPLLKRVREGHSSSLLCFGQTGTGKTHTLVAALEYVFKNLMGSSVEVTFFEIHGKKCYDLLSNRKIVHLRSDKDETVHVRGARSVVSLSPSETADLHALQRATRKSSSSSSSSDAQAVTSEVTSSLPLPGVGVEVVDYESLVRIVQEALKIRSSEVTERNPISSRSHAVCVIKLISAPASTSTSSASSSSTPSASKIEFESDDPSQLKYYGKLTLVDLAGSERNYETTKMSAVQHRESAEINFALMALKDCFRAYFALSLGKKTILKINSPGGVDISKTQRVSSNSPSDSCPTRAPYRASPLTRVLRECFEDTSGQGGNDSRHHTAIITTLSPTAADAQHTLNSLEHVVLMNPALQAKVHDVIVEVPLLDGFLSGIPISAWTPQQVLFWLSTTNNGRFSQLVLPPGLDGKGLMKLNIVALSALCEGTLRAARQDEEGTAWVVPSVFSEDGSISATHNYLGRALWAALRREQQFQRLAEQTTTTTTTDL